MTVARGICRRAFDLDLVAFVHDARGSQWADFREHYPLCADCSVEVRTWTELESVLQGGVPPATLHPAPEELLRLETREPALEPDYERIVEFHVAGCRPCADEIATLRAFDFTDLDAAAATASAPSPVATPSVQPLSFGTPPDLGALSAPVSADAAPAVEHAEPEVAGVADAAAGSVPDELADESPVVATGDDLSEPGAAVQQEASGDPATGELEADVEVAAEVESDVPPVGREVDLEVAPERETETGAPGADVEEAPEPELELEGDAETDDESETERPVELDAPRAVDFEAAALLAAVAPATVSDLPQRMARAIRHPAVGVSVVAVLLLSVLWGRDLPKFPFGVPAGRVLHELPEARVAIATVGDALAAAVIGEEDPAMDIPSALSGIENEELPPAADDADMIQVAMVRDDDAVLADAPGLVVRDEAADNTDPIDPWALARLDEAAPVKIIAAQLAAGVEFEVPVPLTVPAGAVLQVQIRGTGTREIVERLQFPGARDVVLRVPAAWLVPGRYNVEVGVVRRDPTPVRVASYELVVF